MAPALRGSVDGPCRHGHGRRLIGCPGASVYSLAEGFIDRLLASILRVAAETLASLHLKPLRTDSTRHRHGRQGRGAAAPPDQALLVSRRSHKTSSRLTAKGSTTPARSASSGSSRSSRPPTSSRSSTATSRRCSRPPSSRGCTPSASRPSSASRPPAAASPSCWPRAAS